nr:MAG TPA: hypothetical protein [Caudoviricetes sp.]
MMLLNQMLQAGRMCEFIVEVNDITAEEKHWDFYLHKVFDKSFADYLKEVQKPAEPETADMKQVETTVKSSMNILENFKLD